MASDTTSQSADVTIKTVSDLEFVPLNPARGDAAPQAGVLWGDIREDVASGVILKFADGFSSPPHIHNITYRAVVISGGIHNDDPDAAKMWMGPGSFWTQPAGESHITAAEPGQAGVAFLEIQSGPYLVQPVDKAFDNGERPVNLLASNMVWLNATDRSKVVTDSGVAAISYLWEHDGAGAAMLKLPSGSTHRMSTMGGDMKAVIIQGKVDYRDKNMEPGAYFASGAGVEHVLSCSDGPCLIYVRTDGDISVK